MTEEVKHVEVCATSPPSRINTRVAHLPVPIATQQKRPAQRGWKGCAAESAAMNFHLGTGKDAAVDTGRSPGIYRASRHFAYVY